MSERQGAREAIDNVTERLVKGGLPESKAREIARQQAIRHDNERPKRAREGERE